jgi:hypothetical protein
MKELQPQITNCVFKYDTLVFYDEHLKGKKNDSNNVPDMDELREKRFSGKMSEKSKKDCKKTIKRWISAYECYIKSPKQNNIQKQKRLVFLTLTLPAQQIHPDQVIKRVCFDNFLKKLQNNYGLVNYIWKAELQKNFNIHFHLIIDCFADKKKVRKDWETSIELLGYMTRYKNKHGEKTTRTTQIEGIRDNKMMAIYIAKYMSKDNSELMPCGRVWGCSDKLRELKDFNCSAVDIPQETYEKIKCNKYSKFLFDEFFTVIYSGESLLNTFKGTWIGFYYEEFLYNNWIYLYKE